jgi:lambda family phage portal protein
LRCWRTISSARASCPGPPTRARDGKADKKKNAKVDAAFKAWAAVCDAEGQLDFYGMQTLAVREMVEGGEVLARRRWRKPQDGLAVPVQVQLLEADFLDDNRSGYMPNGNLAISGIEFDAVGRRTAYWLWKQHPGNNFGWLQQSIVSNAVPASEIAHLYEKQRTQARGVPWGSPVIRKLRDLDDYEFAEGIRKKIEASCVAFVTAKTSSMPASIRTPARPAAPGHGCAAT